MSRIVTPIRKCDCSCHENSEIRSDCYRIGCHCKVKSTRFCILCDNRKINTITREDEKPNSLVIECVCGQLTKFREPCTGGNQVNCLKCDTPINVSIKKQYIISVKGGNFN